MKAATKPYLEKDCHQEETWIKPNAPVATLPSVALLPHKQTPGPPTSIARVTV